MCGIAGIYVCSHSETPIIREEWFRVLDEGVQHRGPDGHARIELRIKRPDGMFAHVALVHRRLSIIDHDGGAQPMTVATPQGELTVVFNGCIYNHRELRKELEREGARFRSHHSDTEVIPLVWRHWGFNGLQRLDGMFAFAILDHASGELILARDLAGEKPLYFREHARAGIFAFASSAAPLERLGRSIPSIGGERSESPVDPESMAGWIRFGFGPATPFRNISALNPGQVSQLQLPVGSMASPWSRSDSTIASACNTTSRIPTLDEFEDAISRSVTSRIEADTDVGCFLSGGIDSALVAALAARQGHPLPTFTVRMPDREFDESSAAAETAKALGLPHHVLDCEPDPIRDLETLISQTGVPFADSSLLPSLWVSRAARQHVKVALGGDGGDELFMGYERQRVANMIGVLSHLGASTCRSLARSLRVDHPGRLRSRAARLCSASIDSEYEDLVAIFPHALRDHVISLQSTLRPSSRYPSMAERARDFDLRTYLPQDLLRKTDTASMSVGLEVRSPLLAKEVFELAAGTPTSALLRYGRKWILKRLAARMLPDRIITRPKRGFAVPIGRWIREDNGDFGTFIADMVNSTDPWPSGIIGFELNLNTARRMFEAHQAGRSDHSQRLYALVVLALWCRWMRAK